MDELIMLRYGELSTKGKNKRDFINLLGCNVKHALKKFSNLTYDIKYDHIYIHLNGEKYDDVSKRLLDVSGIYSFSKVYRLPIDLDVLKQEALKLALAENKKTFKVHTKRPNKSFPIHSEEINRLIAGEILRNSDYKVDVHNPELMINITVREDYIYLFTDETLAAGGYPLGSGGKSLMMLSGGIDSPVAAYLMMKRGIKIECIHFASPPYTNEAVITKIKDLLKKLTAYQKEIKLFIVPFTKLQEEIYHHVNISYAITIMRRMMYRIAEGVAHQNQCLALVNGESIGQVASQTLESMSVINEVIHMPVIRPVACMDKLEIIDIAQKIGTYDISIRPHEDCCTIFTPKQPATKPKSYKAEALEETWDYQTMINECIEQCETIVIDDHYKEVKNKSKDDEKREDSFSSLSSCCSYLPFLMIEMKC